MSSSTVAELQQEYAQKDFSDSPHLEFLRNITVGEVVAEKPIAITMPGSSKLEQVLEAMAKHNFTSMPLTQPDGSIQGILNLNDIALVIAFQPSFKKYSKPSDLVDLQGMDFEDVIETKVLQDTASDLLGVSEESKTIWSYPAEYPLLKVMDYMVKGVHRLLIETTKGLKVVSQSDVLVFLQLHKHDLGPILDKTLFQLQLVRKHNNQVQSMSLSDSALTGFQLLYNAGDMLNGIPILDAHGGIVTTLSCSDLRGLSTRNMKYLLLPVLQFLRIFRHGGKITQTAHPKSSLGEVMDKFAYGRVHRLWVVNPAGLERIDGVIYPAITVVTLSDIINKLGEIDYSRPDRAQGLAK